MNEELMVQELRIASIWDGVSSCNEFVMAEAVNLGLAVVTYRSIKDSAHYNYPNFVKTYVITASGENYLVQHDVCPICGRKLSYFSGLEHMPAYLFCETCNDVAYDENTGRQIARLE